MTFEWDESKNGINREKHGLDFDAVFTFDWEMRWWQTARGAATVNDGMRRWAYTPGKYIRWFLRNAVSISGSSA
jgi:uncharacterized DUF497 family protein